MTERFWRFAFRLLYNELAFTYDLVSRAVSLGQWRCWQRTVLSHLSPPESGTVLEFAHGSGDLQLDLNRAGYETVALDRSPMMGRIARRKLLRANLPARLLGADAVKLPLKSASFAAIVCTFPTAFIFQAEVLAEMARVLQPAGSAVIVLTGQLHGGGPVRALIRLLYRLTGQRPDLLSEGSLADLFHGTEFTLRIEVAPCAGSSAQLVVLRLEAVKAVAQEHIGLDITPEI